MTTRQWDNGTTGRVSGQLFVAACALLVLAGSLRAQSPVVGGAIGWTPGVDLARIQVYAGSDGCGIFQTGSSSMFSIGARLGLPMIRYEEFSPSIALWFERHRAVLSTPPLQPTRDVDEASGALVDVAREYRLESTFDALRLDLAATYPISDMWSLSAGPSIGATIRSTARQIDTILSERNFLGIGTRSRVMTEGMQIDHVPVLLGGVLTITGSFSMGGAMSLTPSLSLRGDILSTIRGAQWRTISLGGGIGIAFGGRREDDTVAPPPIIPPPPAAPSATLALYGVDSAGVRSEVGAIRVIERRYRRYVALLPTIYFDRSADTFASRYRLRARGDAERFTLDSLEGRDALSLNHQLLDVIGRRLMLDPSARITILGSASEDEPLSLARGRAERVRRYLVDVWRIESARMRVTTEPVARGIADEDLRAERRGVTIGSSDPAIIAPIVVERTERRYDPPNIGLDPRWEAAAGVASWKLAVRSGSTSVASFTSSSDMGRLGSFSWSIPRERLEEGSASLVAELEVRDSLGRVVMAIDTMPLVVEAARVSDEGGGAGIEQSIAAFDYNSSEVPAEATPFIERLASSIESGRRVTITGHTDRTGAESYNEDLSSRRAARVAGILVQIVQSRGIRIEPHTSSAGAEVPLFDNDLPEGRVLSRGVVVVVEAEE